MKLLVIEDSEPLRRSIVVGLSHLGFTLDDTGDGAEGLSMALNGQYDVIILDLMLPHMDGMEILKTLRAQSNQTRVIILSAKNHTQDRVDGLLRGADDYLTKPFSFQELHARLLTIMRRGELNSIDNSIRIGDFCINLEHKTFLFQDQVLELTPNEFKIVEYIFKSQGRVVSTEMISEAVVGNFDHLSKNAIEAHLSSIRRKVRAVDGNLPIKHKRGFGYMVSQ
ncbi:response regulator transcription factor [Celerinatantimonas sp. YJH-8]|uniref:response regulator transcription factor n=1 Tax=Celerinatantimonas sp. YJH-8 TaxID=3228714 RepID=UPI0038C63B9D